MSCFQISPRQPCICVSKTPGPLCLAPKSYFLTIHGNHLPGIFFKLASNTSKYQQCFPALNYLQCTTAGLFGGREKSESDIKTRNCKQMLDVFFPHFSSNSVNFFLQRERQRYFSAVHAIVSDVEDVGISSSKFEDFSITTRTEEGKEQKISVEVSGTKTRAIFDDVFEKLVVAAQPIQGFRRVKGGKTPDIPRDVLLEVLGPTRVYKEVIKKVINSTVAEYVEKEGIKVSKDLRVEQSFEDLEDAFVPDERFSFDAVIQLQ